MKLADCAHDDGKKVRPSIKHIARRAETSERSAQMAIRDLCRLKVLVLDKLGGGRRASRYHFDLAVLDRIYRETQAKWLAEDEATGWTDPSDEDDDGAAGGAAPGGTGAKSAPVKPAKAAKTTGAKSAPVNLTHPRGAAGAPYPLIEPKTQQADHMQPDQIGALVGDMGILAINQTELLIPFDSVLGMIEAAGEQQAKAATGISADYIPGDGPAFRAECRRLVVDPLPIVKRLLAENARRRRVGRDEVEAPTGYLIRSAQKAAAERDGMTVAEIAEASRQHQAHAAGRKAAPEAELLDPAAMASRISAAMAARKRMIAEGKLGARQ
jgi:hypothetical protein